jgi:DNA-binding response OmpR family regulator
MHKVIKILLAEDEPSLGQIIKESLESRAYQVVLCKDGEEALESYYKEKPQLLVLDVMMPKKDGFTLAKEIRMQDAKTPIIFLTAKSQTRDVIEGFTTGGNDYLKKPFSMEELIVRIKNLLNKKTNASEQTEVNIGTYLFNFK